jgi:hypothetical protein
MSSEDPYKSPSGHEPKKSNTALIVIIVLAVLTIPALCLCGGAAVYVWTVPAERSIQIDLPDESEAVPITDTVPPIEAVPPIQLAPGDEPPSGDDSTTK